MSFLLKAKVKNFHKDSKYEVRKKEEKEYKTVLNKSKQEKYVQKYILHVEMSKIGWFITKYRLQEIELKNNP